MRFSEEGEKYLDWTLGFPGARKLEILYLGLVVLGLTCIVKGNIIRDVREYHLDNNDLREDEII